MVIYILVDYFWKKHITQGLPKLQRFWLNVNEAGSGSRVAEEEERKQILFFLQFN